MNELATRAALPDLLAQLSRAQLRHIAALMVGLSRVEAAETQGLRPDLVYHWPALVLQAAALIRQEPEEAARYVFKQALLKAALIKVAALDSDNEANRQKAASEIIEGVLGRSFQRPESSREEFMAELAAEAEQFRQQLAARFPPLPQAPERDQ